MRWSDPLRPGVALALLAVLHAFAATAAMWLVGQRTVGAPDRGGVFAPDFVPPGASLPFAAALAVAYGVTAYHLFRRNIFGLALTTAVAAAQLVLVRVGDHHSGAAHWLVLALAGYVVVADVRRRRFVRRSPRNG